MTERDAAGGTSRMPVRRPAPVSEPDADVVAPQGPVRHLTQGDLAARWRVSRRTLERWRNRGTGPAWLAIGVRVLYRTEDVLAYEAAHRHGSAG